MTPNDQSPHLPDVTIHPSAIVDDGAQINRDVPDFALLIGVLVRQTGWMSAFGKPVDLSLTGKGQVTCPHAGDIYRLQS